MSAIFVFALIALYAVIALKVEEWTTIFILGFRIETPQAFLHRPGAYIFVRRALLGVAAVAALTAKSPPWYVGVAVLIGIGLLAASIGRKRAYNTFRRLHRFLAEDETDPKELADIEAGARLTDSELKARVALAKEHAI